jgi:hypothetical protein
MMPMPRASSVMSPPPPAQVSSNHPFGYSSLTFLEPQPAVSTGRRSSTRQQNSRRARASVETAAASTGATSVVANATSTPSRTAPTSAGVTAPQLAVTSALPTRTRSKKKNAGTAPPLPAGSLYRLDTRPAQRDGIAATSVSKPTPIKDIVRPKGEHGRRTKGNKIGFNMRTYLNMHRPLWRSARVSFECSRVPGHTHILLQQCIRIFSYEMGLDFNLKLCDQSKLKLGLIARKVRSSRPTYV